MLGISSLAEELLASQEGFYSAEQVSDTNNILQIIAKHFGMEISLGKSETMAVLGQGPVRYKIFVDNRRLQ